MSKYGQLHTLAFALVLIGAVSGCATYRKCGLRGCPGDAPTTAKVQAQLDQYPVLQPPNSVRAQTLNGVVYLHGQVDTDLERELAESVAIDAAGGVHVVDSIAVSNIGK